MTEMHVDALSLLIMMVSSIIVVCHDRTLGFFSRATVCFAGAMCFAQAMWLLGIWEPSAAGYPLPRLLLDISLAVAVLGRTRVVLVEHYRRHHRQRSYLP